MHPIDVEVGSRVRKRRNELRVSQQSLASALGLSFQQIQKYELGKNRIGASRLYELSRILDVPISYFFEERSSGPAASALSSPAGEPDVRGMHPELLHSREAIELIEAYYSIENVRLRRHLLALARVLARREGK